MLGKGKFKLLSYILDDYLIFYKSLNRNKKILAFSIIETDEFYPLIPKLNAFLNKRILNYYSIQINVAKKKKKVFLLNFEDRKKDRIIKIFNIINQKLIDDKNQSLFLKRNRLEKKFLDIVIKNLNSNLSILKSSDSILIKNEEISTFLNFYNININNLENNNSFIHNFLNFIRNLNHNGYLIFNFKIALNNNLTITTYFVDQSESNKPTIDVEKKVNQFFNILLLKKQKLDLNKIFCLLWRSEISNNYLLFEEISELFLPENQYNFNDLSKFNSQFEYNLLKNQIKCTRINQNLLLIEPSSLFFCSPISNFKLILKIFKKYYSRYFIYILILNEKEYNKLLKIEKVKYLKNVMIMNPNKFLRLNLDFIGKSVILKNT